MKLRCKSGDLAIVIHDILECAANIGRIVQIRGPLEFSSRYRHHCWLIKPVQNDLWMVDRYGRISAERVTWRAQIEHPDAWLLPIRPEELDACHEQSAQDLDQFLARLETTPQENLTEKVK